MGNCLKSDKVQQPVRNTQAYHVNEATNEDKTILKLKAYRDKLLSQKRALYKNSDKAQNEAKTLIKDGKKDRAMFALKRKKLYDNMVQDIENQYTIIEKTVIDVESKVQLGQMTKVLKETNDLIKELDTAVKLEELQEIGQDIRNRELETKEFNKMFEQHNVDEDEVNKMFDQFESEIKQEMRTSSKVQASQYNKAQENMVVSNRKPVVKEESSYEDEEVRKQLQMLT